MSLIVILAAIIFYASSDQSARDAVYVIGVVVGAATTAIAQITWNFGAKEEQPINSEC